MSEEKTIKTTDHPLLKHIPATLWESLMQIGQCRYLTFAKESWVCAPTGRCEGLHILLSGKAMAYTGCHRTAVLRSFCPGDVFGVSDWYNDDSPDAFSYVRAETLCTVCLLTKPAMVQLLDECPSFRHDYLSFLTGRVRFLNRKIGYLTAGSAEYKLSRYLLSLEGAGQRTDQPDEVTPDLSLSALADMLSLGRASLYRAFDTLTADGFITKNGKKILLHDRQRMSDYYLNTENKNN